MFVIFFLITAIWPFHHKVQHAPENVFDGHVCIRQGDFWFYHEPTQPFIGISSKSCFTAYKEWQQDTEYVYPVKRFTL